jgi:hypothetical protein
VSGKLPNTKGPLPTTETPPGDDLVDKVDKETAQ